MPRARPEFWPRRAGRRLVAAEADSGPALRTNVAEPMTETAVSASDAGREVDGVLILGGAHGALAVARSLGRKGVPVALVTDDHPLPKLSRYVGRNFDWPGPQSPDAVSWLQSLARTHGLQDWLLVPCADAEVQLIAEHRDALRRSFRIVSLDWSVLKSVCDKNELAKLAARHEIPFPRSFHVDSVVDIATLDVAFPVLLKPARRHVRNRFTHEKAWRAETRAQLQSLYIEAVASVGRGDVTIQEYIPGGRKTQFSYAALWAEGAPVAELEVRRSRQYPVDVGISSFVETADEPAMREVARKLLGAIGYEGLVEIDFKFDERDGRFKPLDVNTRVWAWIGLSEAAGVDFAAALLALARGDVRSFHPGQRVDARWVHFSRDVLATIALMRMGELRLPEYLASFRRPLVGATFTWSDPLPGLTEAPLIMSRQLQRRFRNGRKLGAETLSVL